MSETATKVKIKVKRGDAASTRYDTYEVPLKEKMCIFNALEYIISYIDPTLTFYTSCRIGKCMGCTMMVDGKRKLACTTVVEGDITLDPDSKYPVVRDLVVDMSGSEE